LLVLRSVQQGKLSVVMLSGRVGILFVRMDGFAWQIVASGSLNGTQTVAVAL